MKTERFYLPIKTSSLAHYFGRALILPSKYFKNKAHDIQDALDSSNLLSKVRWVDDSDCSIEILLTEGELAEVVPLSRDFFTINVAIPISRVTAIYFLNKEQCDTILWNINSGAAYIPQSLARIDTAKESHAKLGNSLELKQEANFSQDFSTAIKFYDHFLGGVAFMRLAGEEYMNYSENYFAVLANFNNLVKEDYEKAIRPQKINEEHSYTGLFTKTGGHWSNWQSFVYQNVDEVELEKIASIEEISLKKKLGIVQLDSIDTKSKTYDFAILASYGDRKSKSTDNLVSDLLSNKIQYEKREEIALLFGLHVGYSHLRNRYKVQNSDKSVKFQLNSKLDYYTIESVYQYVFNRNKRNYAFDYLDQWIPAQNPTTIQKKGSFIILDKLVIAKKKPQIFSQEYIDGLLQNISPRIVYSTISSEISKWLPPFAKVDLRDVERYLETIVKTPIRSWFGVIASELKLDYESALQEREENLQEKFQQEVNRLNSVILELSNQINDLNSQVAEKVVIFGGSKANTDHQTEKLSIVEVGKTKASNSRRPKENRADEIPIESASQAPEDDKTQLTDAISIEVDYHSMDPKEVKAIAKSKGIKTNQSIEKLITAIKSIKTML